MKKPILLMTCSTFVLASLTAYLPPAMADDGVAGGFYYSIPFADAKGNAGEPMFGFRMDRRIEEDVTFAPDAWGAAGDPLRPAMVDLRFTDEGPSAFMFGGMDALPIVAGPLGFHGGLGNAGASQEQEDQEHIWMYGGGAVALGLIICAIAGCFDGGDGGEGKHSEPCWVAREVYGKHDVRWRMFRNWLLGEAPVWFRALYVAHGPRFAAYIADKPNLKRAIRAWMNATIARTTRA